MGDLFVPTTIFYGLATALIVGVEVYGVTTKRKGDTITENWKHIDTHSPPWLKFIWRVFTAGLLMWTLLHFHDTSGSWQ